MRDCSANKVDIPYPLFASDGRLATTCYDAKIRLYAPDFRLAVPPKVATIGKVPHKIEFNPVRNVLAVAEHLGDIGRWCRKPFAPPSPWVCC